MRQRQKETIKNMATAPLITSCVKQQKEFDPIRLEAGMVEPSTGEKFGY